MRLQHLRGGGAGGVAARGGVREIKQALLFCEQKRSKKNFDLFGMWRWRCHQDAKRSKSFFGSFFSKKERLACLFLLALAGAAPAQTIGGDFTLRDATGQVVTARHYAGTFLLVFFGYTNCPDLCPVTLYNVGRALVLLGPRAARWQVLFITVDPARDTPAALAQYTALFSPRITGLTGTPAQIAAVERGYHVYVGPPDPKTGEIEHSAILFIMGPDGHFITGVPAETPALGLEEVMKEVGK